MLLEGTVTNVAAFGAFVDIGVHQDGLVHVSQLSDQFVRDASEVVKVGQKVQVTVVEVDLKRNRIALSMKSKVDLDNRRSTGDDRDARPNGGGNRNNGPRPQGGRTADFRPNAAPNNDWFSQALSQAKKK